MITAEILNGRGAFQLKLVRIEFTIIKSHFQPVHYSILKIMQS